MHNPNCGCQNGIIIIIFNNKYVIYLFVYLFLLVK